MADRENILETFVKATGLSRNTVRELLDNGWWYVELTGTWSRTSR